VRERRDGTRHMYRADPRGLLPLRQYLERYWDSALAAFAEEADTADDFETQRTIPSTTMRRNG
jgi:hypothetical protein